MINPRVHAVAPIVTARFKLTALLVLGAALILSWPLAADAAPANATALSTSMERVAGPASSVSRWLESTAAPAATQWPETERFQLAAALILCVLIGGIAGRAAGRLPLPSRQGRLALAALAFLIGTGSAFLGGLHFSVAPLLIGLGVFLLSAPVGYMTGIAAEMTEHEARKKIASLRTDQGTRATVLAEIDRNEFDKQVYREALRRAGDDEDAIRTHYIALRSRKIAHKKNPQTTAQPGDAEYERIDFVATDNVVPQSHWLQGHRAAG